MSGRDQPGPIDRERVRPVQQPIEAARGLPNDAYTSAAFFRYERDEVLGRSWAAIAFIDSIPAGPHAHPVSFMGLPLLVIRDRHGELRVFHNVCSHRGMLLVPEATAIHGLITCRYHRWSYAANGDLKATPHIGGVDQHECAGFNKSEHGLKAVQSATFMGLLFVNVSGDAPEFATYAANLVRRSEELVGAGGWAQMQPGVSGATLVLDVPCNWKLAVENYCESYHLPWLHPELNSYSRLEDHYCFLDEDFSGQGSLAYRGSDVAGTHLPQFAAWPADRPRVAEYPSMYPNVLLGFQPDHAFAIILTPLAPDRTREELRIFYVGDGATADAYAACRAATLESWRVVFAQDIMAVEGMQLGRASPGYDGGVFSPVMDVPTHHFHRWIADRLAAPLTHAGARP
jgi:choline monooxygenase